MLTKNRQTILIVIIYLAFISLGLPDGVLGVAWPAIRSDMSLPLESVGALTTLILCMSALSSFASGKMIEKWGTGGVTFASAMMTGLALLGYAVSPSFLWLIVCSIPLGFGQGAVDSGLNLYVAQHYTARHMNWLHCFWGMGASLGPLIMTRAIAYGDGWRKGYGWVSALQLTLTAVLLVSLATGLWKNGQSAEGINDSHNDDFNRDTGLSKKSAQAYAVLLFFLYAGVEFTMGIWMNSVFVESRGIPVHLAGLSATCIFASIMAGRFVSGMIVNKMGNMRMIRLGLFLAVTGSICCVLSGNFAGILAGVVMVGLGFAPIYPCLMHETPVRFKKSVSDKLIGYQVGAACLGGSLVASGTGIVLSRFSLELLFPIIIGLLLIAFVINEVLHCHAKIHT